MADDALVRRETVALAAEALAARGERASVRAVIRELGGGSPNTVVRFLRELRTDAERVLGAAACDEEPAETATPGLPQEIRSAILAFTESVTAAFVQAQATATRAANERLATVLAAHTLALAERDQRHAKVLAAIRDQVAATDADLEEAFEMVEEAGLIDDRVRDLKEENEGQKERLDALKTELLAVRIEADGAIKAKEIASDAAEHAEREAKSWRAELAAARAELLEAREASATVATDAHKVAEILRAELVEARVSAGSRKDVADRLGAEFARVRSELADASRNALAVTREAQAARTTLRDELVGCKATATSQADEIVRLRAELHKAETSAQANFERAVTAEARLSVRSVNVRAAA